MHQGGGATGMKHGSRWAAWGMVACLAAGWTLEAGAQWSLPSPAASGGQAAFGKSASIRDRPLFDVLNAVTDAVKGSAGPWWVETGAVHLCVFSTMEERVYEIELDDAARDFFTFGTARLGENYDVYYAPDSSMSRFEYVEADGAARLAVRGRRGDIEKVLKRLAEARIRFRYRKRKVLLVMPE